MKNRFRGAKAEAGRPTGVDYNNPEVGHEKWLNFEYLYRVGTTKFADRLDVEYQGKEGAKIFGLNNWKTSVAIS